MSIQRAAVVSCVVSMLGCGNAGGADASALNDASSPDASAADAGPLDAGAEADSAPSDGFVLIGRAPESCPLPAAECGGWPTSGAGTVYKYTSKETFHGTVFDRTFHVFVPVAATASAPLTVILHGGNGSGARFLAAQRWTEAAEALPVGLAWNPNVDGCRARPTTEAIGLDYRDSSNASCTPPVQRWVNAKPFVAVFPDGVPDPGKVDARHWEDGRMPSPGFGTAYPNRDDVGFIAHVLRVLLEDSSLPLDPNAAYLAGASNGGIMTQRIAANAGSPDDSPLRSISAYAAFVSNVAAPLSPVSAPTIDFAMVLFHGTGIDTPDCDTPGCAMPTIAGDGRMPFGLAGGSYFVNSPDRGTVISGPDTITQWRAALGAAGAPTTSTSSIGFFTTKETTSFGASPLAFESYVTDGGGHTFSSTREDFLPVARAWAFLSSYRRNPSGALARTTPTWVTGPY